MHTVHRMRRVMHEDRERVRAEGGAVLRRSSFRAGVRSVGASIGLRSLKVSSSTRYGHPVVGLAMTEPGPILPLDR